MKETDLYQPVKSFLEGQGFAVKGEVNTCDLVAVRGAEEPVIVELKTALTMALLLQGVNRQAISDAVYLAVPAKKGPNWRKQARDGTKLCRRLGLGLLSVDLDAKLPVVRALADPGPYRPAKAKKRKQALLKEFAGRTGDPNTGGTTRTTIVTAYRQNALRILGHIHSEGPSKPAQLVKQLDIPNAPSILQNNHYGWFDRIERGIYGMSETGQAAVETYAADITLLQGL